MKSTALLRRHILAHRASVCVFGQGHVGLTLACAAAVTGFSVTFIDTDEARVEELGRGGLTVPGVKEEAFEAAIATGRATFTSRTDVLKEGEVILICVPTPIRGGIPDLTLVEEASKHVARYLHPGQLVVLESTSYPGTTDGVVRPLLEASDLKADSDFLLACSPERTEQASPAYGLSSTPKVVGGLTPEATGAAALFYRQLVDEVVVVSSCRAAEMARLLEDTFRQVNVALVNEMAMLCHDVGIDAWEVVEAAQAKAFGFTPFHPGPGDAGHFLPLDGQVAGAAGGGAPRQFRILELAHDINDRMPGYVARRIWEAMNERDKAVQSPSVLVLGIAYKADDGDVRQSPSLKIMAHLSREGARISFHDPHVSTVPMNGRILSRTELTRRAVIEADCVALLTPHRAYDLDWIAQHASLVFDARNAYGAERRSNVVRL
ncbi:MAG: nucleotide sugar dehydrogenase [Actinomycetota bacterium]